MTHVVATPLPGVYIEAPEEEPLVTIESEDAAYLNFARAAGATVPDLVGMTKIKHGSFIMERASTTDVESLRWLWRNRILLGFINVVVGEEGVGKGNFVAWLVAQVTRGKLPGDLKGKARRVLVIGDEDSWSRVWVPRLTLAGADLEKVTFIHEVEGEYGNRPFDVRKDADELSEFVNRYKVGLVYFDQFLDTLGVGTDENKTKPIRDALQPLRTAAHAVDCAFLGTLHPNKRKGGSFRDRMNGTPAWNQLSRSGLLLAKHPTDLTRRALVVAKHNYSEGAPCFEFSIKAASFKTDDGELIEQSCVADWDESALTEDDLLAGASGGTITVSKADQGRDYIEDRLNGAEVPSQVLKKELKEKFGIGEREAKRLAADMDLTVRRGEEFPARTYWRR